MLIKLWGVRGSICAPLTNREYRSKISRIIEHTLQKKNSSSSNTNEIIEALPDSLKYLYGGNTTCAAVTSDSGKTYILDCGTGIRELGYEMMKGDCASGKGVVDIFLTHNHWDHLQGLPFFTPLYIKGNKINFYSPYPDQKQYLIQQMDPPFFPAPFEGTASEKNFITLEKGINLPLKLEKDLIVDIHPLKHPNGCHAYRFRQNGKTFVFATDCEFTGESLEMGGPEMDFFNHTDLLVLDSQYTLDESFTKFDWGHTSFTMAVNCGVRWKVKNLVLTHHEPSYSDDKLQENYMAALEHRKYNDSDSMNIYMAREGMTFTL
ncbi:MAG TPA: MBL fold metallo-hydrolase [Spirochaetota bacterium]|nr:MBL fold metallo-hydrolase [Spirochaetota bacterium]HPI89630.1 MBL fold metallo-hydrolase [Spirochaetota bacterium]HPR49209.1 MBL fold metallo-hydrolase [Spirochaetota bacterium]